MNTNKGISRRSALKVMGAFIVTAYLSTLSTMGLTSVTACSASNNKQSKIPKRLVFYFTATGNSLFVARGLDSDPISIPQALKDGQLDFEADEIGFVFPDYAAAVPLMVREFVEKGHFKASYFFL